MDVDLPNERVVVSTTLPTSHIQSMLESTGRPVLVRGVGAVTAASVGKHQQTLWQFLCCAPQLKS